MTTRPAVPGLGWEVKEEERLQAALVQHLELRGPKDLVFWHTPNSGKRHIGEAVKFKRMGVRAGVSDLILVRSGNAFALELKTPSGRPTDGQLEFLDDFRAAGGHGCICYGLDSALKTLTTWGLLGE